MLLSMAFGVVITLLVSTPSQVKNKLALRSQRKKISELEAGLAEEKSKVEELQKQLTQTAVETPNKEENTPTENKPVSTEKPK
jgi:predicted RNase H-like nuclease (RuvC/YqgF family)